MENDVATCNGAEDAGRADEVAGQQVSGGGPDVAVAPFSADGLKLRAADVLARGPGGPHISGGPPAADEATPELFGLCVEAVKSLLAERRTDVRRCCGDGVEQAELVGWLAADATERQEEGLRRIANTCPVSRSLHPDIDQDVHLTFLRAEA